MNIHITNLLAALMSYAPDGSAQVKAAELVQNGERHGANEDEIVCALANAISDGLMHGNWPWTEKTGVNKHSNISLGEWQDFTRSLRRMDTQSKINNLKDWYNDRPHSHVTTELLGGTLTYDRDTCQTCKQVEQYLRGLAHGGYIDKNVHLIDTLAWDWSLKVLK